MAEDAASVLEQFVQDGNIMEIFIAYITLIMQKWQTYPPKSPICSKKSKPKIELSKNVETSSQLATAVFKSSSS